MERATSPEEDARDRKAHLTGRLLRAKDIGQRGMFYWRCEAVTLRPEANYPKVAFIMRQRLERVTGELLHSGTERVGDACCRLPIRLLHGRSKR
jgi:hypothetical protein